MSTRVSRKLRRVSNALVQATPSVGSVKFWSFIDAWTGGGGGVGGVEGNRNTARQAMDGLWTEVCGQQKQSNDPGNNQHILNMPIIGHR